MFSMQKQKGGHYTNKRTTLSVKLSSVSHLVYIPSYPEIL